MKCSVFIATSADGYIATNEGGVDWLHTAGNSQADMSENPDMGFNQFIESVDCIIMGRKCMQVISNLNILPDQWPYLDLPIYVLSHSLKQPPDNLMNKVTLVDLSISDLVTELARKGYQHAYVDGGATITSFLNLGLINQMTITQAPILLGEGIPLFGKLTANIRLKRAQATTFANDFIQTHYQVEYTD